jgi:uroporphyrinogen-III synthase
MKKLVLLSAAILVAVGTSFAQDGKPKKLKKRKVRYHQCDAYKTHYAPIKPERHKHHTCDAYN